MKLWKYLLTLALIAGMLFGGVQFIVPSQAQSTTTTFTNIRATGDIRSGDDITVGDDLTVTDDTTFTDRTAHTGDATFAADVNYTPQVTLTLTMNGWLTPTGAVQLVSSAGNVSISGGRIAPGSQGQLLTLVNVGSNTVTLTETTGLISAGNIALGPLDTATFVYRLVNWYQTAASNN